MTRKKYPFFFYHHSTSLLSLKRKAAASRALKEAEQRRFVSSVAAWFVIPANLLAILSSLGEYGNYAFQYICGSIPHNTATYMGYSALYLLCFWTWHKWTKYGCYLQLDHWPVSISDVKIHIGIPFLAPFSPPAPPPIIPVVRSGVEFTSALNEKVLQDSPLSLNEKIDFLLREDQLSYARNKELYDFILSDSLEDRPEMWSKFFDLDSTVDSGTLFYKEYMGEPASRIPLSTEELLHRVNPLSDERLAGIADVYLQGVHSARIPITTGVRPFVEGSSGQGLHFNLFEIHMSAKVEWHLTDCISFWSWWNLPIEMSATRRQIDLQEAFWAFFHIRREHSPAPLSFDEEIATPVEMFYSTLSTYDKIRAFLKGATILVSSTPPPSL